MKVNLGRVSQKDRSLAPRTLILFSQANGTPARQFLAVVLCTFVARVVASEIRTEREIIGM
jgi:hypothetical protein